MVMGNGRLNNDPITRVILITAAFIAYIAVLGPLEKPLAGSALFLAIIPVLVAGWFAGFWMGLAMGVIASVMGALVLAAVGERNIAGAMTQGILPAIGALSLVGAVVGRLRDVSRRAGVQSLMLIAESRRRQDAESETRAAQEEERRRIAEDVHDDVVQVMAAVNMRIELLRRRMLELEAEIAATDVKLQVTVDQLKLPRIFVIEAEYLREMQRAEAEWIRTLIGDLLEGALWPSHDEIHSQIAEFQRRSGGGH